jgi:hypothetical protein
MLRRFGMSVQGAGTESQGCADGCVRNRLVENMTTETCRKMHCSEEVTVGDVDSRR